jgi:hypothetical protein
MTAVMRAARFVAERKEAICDGPVAKELPSEQVLRHLIHDTGIARADLERYLEGAGSFVLSSAMRGAPLPALLGGIIADAFVTGYHARRFEEAEDA